MSGVDAATIHRATPGVPTVPAPNGVDVRYFTPDDALPRDPLTAVYLGDYKYFPNADAVLYFAQEILPRVRAASGVSFSVIAKTDAGDARRSTSTRRQGSRCRLVDDTSPI